MSSSRIQINNIDKSQNTLPAESPITAFTIIDAPKGPYKPYFIEAGQFSKINEVFGYTTKTYPRIQEVIDVNSSKGLWVSSPYNPIGSKLPVAYVTPAGIFEKHTPVVLGAGEYVEDIGEEIDVLNITNFSSDPSILVPVGQEAPIFTASGSAISTDVLEYNITDKLKINLSFDLNVAYSVISTTDYHFLNTTTPTGSQVMKVPETTTGVLTFIIPGEDPLDLSVVEESDLIKLKVGSVTIGSIASGAGVVVNSLKITGDNTLTGTYAKYFKTTVLDSVWTNSEFLKSVRVYWKASLKKENIVASIFQKYASNRTTKITFTNDEYSNKFKNTVTEAIGVGLNASYSFSWSLNEEDKDGFGNPLEVTSKVDNQTLINIYTIKTFDGLLYTKTKTTVSPTNFVPPPAYLSGGSRVAVEDVNAFWSVAQDPDFETVDVFFATDPLEDDNTFFNLADTHTLARFVFPKPIERGSVDNTIPKLGYGYQYIAITTNQVRTSNYTKETYNSYLIGSYTQMLLDSIDKAYGGAAIMFLNNGLGLGGQLKVSTKKALNDYKYSEAQLRILDDKNYNPIITGPYGVMVTSHKTCNPGEISDWSYVGHVSAFLDFQKEVKYGVMIPQLGKPNNEYYRGLRASQVTDMLRKRTTGTNKIWSSGSVDTSTENVNTPDVLAQRHFKINTTVKVDIFSEGVDLTFINESQV